MRKFLLVFFSLFLFFAFNFVFGEESDSLQIPFIQIIQDNTAEVPQENTIQENPEVVPEIAIEIGGVSISSSSFEEILASTTANMASSTDGDVATSTEAIAFDDIATSTEIVSTSSDLGPMQFDASFSASSTIITASSTATSTDYKIGDVIKITDLNPNGVVVIYALNFKDSFQHEPSMMYVAKIESDGSLSISADTLFPGQFVLVNTLDANYCGDVSLDACRADGGYLGEKNINILPSDEQINEQIFN